MGINQYEFALEINFAIELKRHKVNDNTHTYFNFGSSNIKRTIPLILKSKRQLQQQ